MPWPEPDTRRAGLDDDLVPLGLRAAAGWTWRLVVVAGGLYLLLRLLDTFKVLVVPVLVALLVVALVKPLADLLAARPADPTRPDRPAKAGLSRGPASLVTLLLTLAVVVGVIVMIGHQVSTGLGDLQIQAVGGWRELQRQLANSPLHLTNDKLSQLIDQSASSLQSNSSRLVTGALEVGSKAADIATGFFVVLFSTYFFLSGGDKIWAWAVRLFPRGARESVDGAGVRAWTTLTAYIRATVVVALVDGFGAGAVAAVLGVPLAMPLGMLVFLGAFIPVIGALVSGIVAVLVALLAKGPVVALLMLAGVVTVQQVEAHVLQPFLMGRAVRVHPLGVILSIGAGVLLAGIVGGLFAVPLAAVVNVVAHYLTEDEATSAADGSTDALAGCPPQPDSPPQPDGSEREVEKGVPTSG